MVIRFVVIDVMNMKRARFAAMLVAVLACLVISAANTLLERFAEVWRVSDIETLSAAPNQMDAGRAIDPAVSALDQTAGFAYGTSATCARNGDCVVVPITFAASLSGASRPLAFAPPITEMMLHLFEMPLRAIKGVAAVSTQNGNPLIGLESGVMVANELTRPSPLIVAFEDSAASAAALNKFLIGHGSIIPHRTEMTKHASVLNGRGVIAMMHDLVELSDGRMRLHFHPGQWKLWTSERRFLLALAGTQGG